MGGKHKQGDRTKNSTRPSSSSHSAELLGNTIPTFFGFSSLINGASTVSTHLPDDAAYSINSDFHVLLKQMNKKDPVTRFKALQLFLDLVNTTETEGVKAVLPLWVRMYCILCTDVDHKVREISHKAHKAVVFKVKKFIAPYLKELAGPWFTSQYDTYAPAASAAALSFEEAFPSSKVNKAIVFCQEEILSYIYNNLINHTPQTLSNPNTTSPEDMRAKYERTVLASLQGYTLYLQKLSPAQIEEARESNSKLLSHSKFWKYSRNKVPLIRNSFYQILIALCQNARFLIEKETQRLSSTIFNNLDESDSIVLQSLWDAALNVLVTVEDCWSYVNVEKQLFLKLNSILKSGGRNVCAIYPNILPLLSKLPSTMLTDKRTFYGSLFESMRHGLEIVSVNQSPAEGKVMAATFVECLKFVISQNSAQLEFCSGLVSDHLIPALDKLLIGREKRSVQVPFFVETSALIGYWHANRYDSAAVYDKLVGDFFGALSSLCDRQRNTATTVSAVANLLDNQVRFVEIFADPNRFRSKSRGRVKFEEDPDEDSTSATVSNQSGQTNAGRPEEFLVFVTKQAGAYFRSAIEAEDKSYVSAIAKFTNLFEPEIIFEEMKMAANETTCFKLFSSYFSKWLMNDKMKCRELIELSFSLLRYVAVDEKEYILDEFCSNWLSDSLQFDVCKALPKYADDEYILRWVRGQKFTNSTVALVKRLVDGEVGDTETPRDVISTLLKAKSNNGEYLVNASAVALMMDVLGQRLQVPAENSHAVQLTQDLILNAEIRQLSLPEFTTLVTALFKLSCCRHENDQLVDTCQTGLETILNALPEQNPGKLTDMLSSAVRAMIVSDEATYSVDQVVLNLSTYVGLVVKGARGQQEADKVVEILRKFLEVSEENDASCRLGKATVERCCRVGHLGNGTLDAEYLQRENCLDLTKCPSTWTNDYDFDVPKVLKYVRWNLYVGHVLNLLLAEREKYRGMPTEQTSTGENEDVSTVQVRSPKDISTSVPPSRNIFTDKKSLLKDVGDFLMAVGTVQTFNRYHRGTKHYRDLSSSGEELMRLATDLLKRVNISEARSIYDHCEAHFGQTSIWWIVKSVIFEILKVVPKKDAIQSDILENCFRQLEDVDLLKSAKNRRNLVILCLIENKYGCRLTEKQWDCIFINLHEFFTGIVEKNQCSDEDVPEVIAASRLYLKLRRTFKMNHAEPSELRILPETCLAWNEVVQGEVYDKVVLLWRKLAKDWSESRDVPCEWITALQVVSDVVVDGLTVRKCQNPNDSVNLAVECVRLLKSPHAVVQVTAFQLCLNTIPDLVRLDTEMFGDNMSKMFQDGKDKSSPGDDNWSLKNFEKDIADNQGIVDALLSDFIVGDNCSVEPFTDAFTYTYSYLLLWRFILAACGEAHSSLRVQYGSWLQDAGHASVLLDSVFKLMPQSVLHGTIANDTCRKYFENQTVLDFRDPIGSQTIEETACLTYRLFLQRLPNYVREWWKQVENKTSGLVDNVTKLYVSPLLISNELKNVQQDRENGFDNIEIKTYPGSREVVATYTIDEVKMDLIMTLPPNYPLGTAKIESSNVLVGTSKWRNLLFQICKYLIHQNGTIWDALVIWKNNLDKKFEGVEECYICFSILQGSSFEIPRLCCHTCKKKFHSNCLYKWFSTSNNSTCPICRNLF